MKTTIELNSPRHARRNGGRRWYWSVDVVDAPLVSYNAGRGNAYTRLGARFAAWRERRLEEREQEFRRANR